jgi:hypothetical protein
MNEELVVWRRLVDVWATGEAAASLGFSAARVSDELDMAGNRPGARMSEAAVLCPAAKLFSTCHAAGMLQSAVALGMYCPIDSNFGCLEDKLIDAQIEAVFLGPEALQRRQLSAAMINDEFLSEFRTWIEEMNRLARRMPRTGIRCLAAGMRLWHWTTDHLRQQTDSRGARIYCDARQGVTFPMADGLCWLLAARALTLDVLALEKSGNKEAATLSVSSFFSDLSTIASVHAVGRVSQMCAGLLFGYSGQFPVSSATESVFDDMRTKLDESLVGALAARDRAERFIRRGTGSLRSPKVTQHPG